MRRVLFSQQAAVGTGSAPPVQPDLYKYGSSDYTPSVVYYTSTHRQADDDVMFMLTVNNCRVVNSSVGNGAIDNISNSNTVNSGTIVVNPASGAIFDVLSPNVIYEFSGGIVDAQPKPHWYFPPPSLY
jgi:hypothetical protein